MIRFYCGVNETKWNHSPVTPGKYACVAPVFGNIDGKQMENRVVIPPGTEVLQDSGAFNDGPRTKLSFAAALQRQITHAYKYNYAEQVTLVASYDILIDEKWVDGKRVKDRWDEASAWGAVEQTVRAAEYLSTHRQEIPYTQGLVLSAQGVSPAQYLECAKQVVSYLDLQTDVFGLGGWCITGRRRKQMLPVLCETIDVVIPYLATQRVNKVHIWGVLFPPALGKLLSVCDRYQIRVSTDSAGPQFKPTLGAWGYGDWRDNNYRRPDVSVRGAERIRHVQTVRAWLDDFRSTQYYRYYTGG